MITEISPNNQRVLRMTNREYHKICTYIDNIGKIVRYDGKNVTYKIVEDGGIIEANPKQRSITLSNQVSGILFDNFQEGIKNFSRKQILAKKQIRGGLQLKLKKIIEYQDWKYYYDQLGVQL